MENNKHASDAINPLKGIAADLLKEVIAANMSMHNAQIDAWKWMAKYKPSGDYINEDFNEDFARNLYLSLNELKLQWYMRPVFLNFWERLKLVLKVVFKGNLLLFQMPVLLEMTTPSDPKGILINITIRRNRDGKTEVTYTPSSDFNNGNLKQSVS